jgi:hypothetical protein
MSLKIIRQNYIGKWMLAAYVLMAGVMDNRFCTANMDMLGAR